MNCKVCGQVCGQNGLRFGVCWECATAESIILDGVDMRDVGYMGRPARTALEKLSMLVERGWKAYQAGTVPPAGPAQD